MHAGCKRSRICVEIAADVYLLTCELVDLQCHLIRKFTCRMGTEGTGYRIQIVCGNLLFRIEFTVRIGELIRDIPQRQRLLLDIDHVCLSGL